MSKRLSQLSGQCDLLRSASHCIDIHGLGRTPDHIRKIVGRAGSIFYISHVSPPSVTLTGSRLAFFRCCSCMSIVTGALPLA